MTPNKERCAMIRFFVFSLLFVGVAMFFFGRASMPQENIAPDLYAGVSALTAFLLLIGWAISARIWGQE
jgi:hypothetical protein